MYSSDLRLKNIFGSIGDGVITVDKNKKIDFINEVAEELTGWKHDEAIGRYFDEIFNIVNKTEDKIKGCIVCEVLETKTKRGLSRGSQLVSKNGKEYYISASFSPIICKDCEETIDGVVVVFRDITRIRNMEEEILKERNNFKLAFNNIPLGALIIDESLNILESNDILLKASGFTRENLIGKPIGEGLKCIYSFEKGCGFGNQCSICDIRKNIVHTLKNESPKSNEIIKRKFITPLNDREVWYSLSYVPLRVDDARQILITIDDITEQVEHENKLKEAKDRAEAANQAKTVFLANMSHELRTPINGIIGMLDLTRLTELNEEQEDNLLTAKNCANTLLNIVNDILDFSKIEAGKIELQRIPFKLKDILDNMEKIHRLSAKEKKLQFKIINNTNQDTYLMGDPHRLTQIINNLLSNAIKFTEQGEVSLEINGLETMNSLALSFSIKDTGTGISKKDEERLFQRFIQLEDSFTKRHQGTGLGLAITKQLVEAMDGEIQVESEIGQGSNFIVKISFQKIGEKENTRIII